MNQPARKLQTHLLELELRRGKIQLKQKRKNEGLRDLETKK